MIPNFNFTNGVLGIKMGYKGCLEFISEGIFCKYSKIKILVLKLLKKVKFWCLAPSKLKSPIYMLDPDCFLIKPSWTQRITFVLDADFYENIEKNFLIKINSFLFSPVREAGKKSFFSGRGRATKKRTFFDTFFYFVPNLK